MKASGVLSLLAAPLRACMRTMQTANSSTSKLTRILLTLLIVPPFGILLVLLRLAAMCRVRIDATTTTPAGLRFRCHPPDLIQLYLWLFDIWEPDLTAFIRRRLAPGDAFIDVGANIGYYSILASRCIGPTGKVVAIEASPVVFDALRETISLNSPAAGNIRPINQAASDHPGSSQVFAGPSHNTGLTTTVASRGMRAQAVIPALPLDDLLTPAELRSARLVKIDVEGGEPAVLAGMTRFLRSCRDDVELLIELSPNWWTDTSLTPAKVLQPFVDAGFHIYSMPNNYWPWRYLWPNRVASPHRMRLPLPQRVGRLDLVLSKTDAESL